LFIFIHERIIVKKYRRRRKVDKEKAVKKAVQKRTKNRKYKGKYKGRGKYKPKDPA